MKTNQKSYTFAQLSEVAQKKACQDYINGWLVTHPEEKNDIDLNWARSMCESDDKTVYNENGDVLDC